jgi:ABC-2 type transport system permease protein
VTRLRLMRHQLRYELLTFWRNPTSRFFTLGLPVVLLVIFVAILGNHRAKELGGRIDLSTYYVPAMLVFGISSAALVDLVVPITAQRERGVLKRRRATPVPAWVLIAARAICAATLSFVVVGVLLAVGAIAYGVDIRASAVPGLLLAVAVGTASFCCLGYAIASFVRSEDAAIPLSQAIVLPLYFISGIFIEGATIPKLLRSMAEVFPVYHLNRALLVLFDPAASGVKIAVGHLAIVALWGIAGLGVAIARFSWSPRSV